VVELGGIGPAPFCGMVLADLGADVVRINRPSDVGVTRGNPVIDRGRRQLAADLKSPDGIGIVRKLIATSDAVIEGFRPGVMERLGLVPAELRADNPRLVVGRMTGWGQTGPEAQSAGHDINYISMAGVLGSIGRPGEAPVPPINLVGDFGGGGMLLAVGVLAGVLNARTTGRGQDVDAAMVDGSALLSAMIFGFMKLGAWDGTQRGVNLLDGGAPYYNPYECADGQYVSVGAIEPQFYAALVEGLGLSDRVDLASQTDTSTWPRVAALFAETFRTRTRDEWADHFAGTDACVAAVLSFVEAPNAPHNVARSTFVKDAAGTIHPAPAPRFSETPLAAPEVPPSAGDHTSVILAELGYGPAEIAAFRASGTVA
jgi:alpha-methylacyl-CoA racemase